MSLTDTRVRKARPSSKAYKLSDGGGMYLLVNPDGSRYWRIDYVSLENGGRLLWASIRS